MTNQTTPNEPTCPLDGDKTNDCDGCVYSGDYHYIDGECRLRSSDEKER